MVGRAFTRPRKCQFLGVRLGVVNHVLQRVHIAVGPHHDGIGCVMEHIDGSDIIGFKAHVAGFGLDHDMWQVDAHDLCAVTSHRIQL